MGQIAAGDRVVVSGPVGDHGTAVMLAREQFGLSGELRSDACSVLPVTRALLGVAGLRFMRDPTRGGIATVAHEIAQGSGATVRLEQAQIPVRGPVRAVCEMLGYDPYYLACEGRVVAVLAPDAAEPAVRLLRERGWAQAAVVGEVREGPPRVVLQTPLGGQRLLEELEDDPAAANLLKGHFSSPGFGGAHCAWGPERCDGRFAAVISTKGETHV